MEPGVLLSTMQRQFIIYICGFYDANFVHINKTFPFLLLKVIMNATGKMGNKTKLSDFNILPITVPPAQILFATKRVIVGLHMN